MNVKQTLFYFVLTASALAAPSVNAQTLLFTDGSTNGSRRVFEYALDGTTQIRSLMSGFSGGVTGVAYGLDAGGNPLIYAGDNATGNIAAFNYDTGTKISGTYIRGTATPRIILVDPSNQNVVIGGAVNIEYAPAQPPGAGGYDPRPSSGNTSLPSDGGGNKGLAFASDGHLYSTRNANLGSLNRTTYPAITGGNIPIINNLVVNGYGLTFGGPDSTLYLADSNGIPSPSGTQKVQRVIGFGGATPTLQDVSGLPTFNNVSQILFGPDGKLYVDDNGANRLSRYTIAPGTLDATLDTSFGVGGFLDGPAGGGIQSIAFTPAAVPGPEGLMVFGGGLFSLAGYARRRRRTV